MCTLQEWLDRVTRNHPDLLEDPDVSAEAVSFGMINLTVISDDTRQLKPGAIFLERPGEAVRDQKDVRLARIEEAFEAGAVVVVTDLSLDDIQANGVSLTANRCLTQADCSLLAQAYFNYPQKKLKLLGVTGTNGKSTIALLAQYFLKELGLKSGVLGTILNDCGNGCEPAKLTTPGAVDLIGYMNQMVLNQCQAICMEVSSHALSQGRTGGLQYDAAIFTNLSGDHLDYHKTMPAYAESKSILFKQLQEKGVAVINQQDDWSDFMIASVQDSGQGRHIVKTAVNADAGEYALEVEAMNSDGLVIQLRLPGERKVQVHAPLVGLFNASNLLQALVAALELTGLSQTISDERLKRLFANCPQVPGRMEKVAIADDDSLPAVLVDYAHTHDALENVLQTLLTLRAGAIEKKMKIWVVVGAGGDRDATKRPKMARVAMALADQVILTSDNPRTEDPMLILDDMVAGVSPENQKEIVVEVDREKAISRAITCAASDDLVLLAGKGHEDYQVIGTEKIHFDDREMARRYLNQRLKESL